MTIFRNACPGNGVCGKFDFLSLLPKADFKGTLPGLKPDE
jgi:hypothetical protein